MDMFNHVLAALRTGTPVTDRRVVRGTWRMQFPAAPAAGCCVVLDGSCLLMPPCGHPLPLEAGDLVFLRDSGQTLYSRDPEPSRGLGQDTDTVLACSVYQTDIARPPHPLLSALPPVIYASSENDGDRLLQDVVHQLGCELGRPGTGSESMVAALVDLLMLQLVRLWFDTVSPEHVRGWAAALSDATLAPALWAMHADPGRAWTVDEMGWECGLSRAVFARRFTAAVGEPPLSYLTGWRMATAGRLLADTDVGVAAVAEQVGYGSESAFGKAFKRAYGTAPGTYRHRFRALAAEQEAEPDGDPPS